MTEEFDGDLPGFLSGWVYDVMRQAYQQADEYLRLHPDATAVTIVPEFELDGQMVQIEPLSFARKVPGHDA